MENRRLKFMNTNKKETIISTIIFEIILCLIFVSNINSSITANTQQELKIISKYLLITNKESNTILHEFDKIDDDLRTLQTIFRLSSNEFKSRIMRSLSQRTKCTISRDKLTSLKSEIDDVLANVSASKNQITCTLNLTDSDNCNELTKVIQCGIQNLKNGFQHGVISNNGSIHEIAKWQNAYESLLDKYEKQSDNLKKSLSQDNQLKFDKLQIDLQNLGKSLNTALDRLESTTISLCVLEIKNGQVEDAIEHSKDLKSLSISQIIKKSYCVGNDTVCLEITQNIFDFINEQTNIDNIVIACETFYNEMESKNDLIPEKAFALGNLIETSPAKDRLQDVFKKIEPVIKEVFQKIGKAIAEPLAKALVKVVACLFGSCENNLKNHKT